MVVEARQSRLAVPFFRPSITEAEIEEVVDCLRSSWLTTGPRTKEFETTFAELIGARHAIALNSCTAALHLAVESLGLGTQHAVLVPTMTFAATAEIVRYQGAVPILVDCDPVTLNMDLEDAARKLHDFKAGRLPVDSSLTVVGIIPVHVGGAMMDMNAVNKFAESHGLWVVEDAAHAFPAAFRSENSQTFQRCGEGTARVTCFSFYANKTITTGEGGMAVTNDDYLADRIRQMSLHGLSHDAWKRFSGGNSWDYRILAPGYKYNLTDIASAIGLRQLDRAESMRCEREVIAGRYHDCLRDAEELRLPNTPKNRVHSWHLYPIQLRLELLSITRNRFMELLKESAVGCSVHWRPLHLHPYYIETFRWQPDQFPVATREWESLISLPIFPGMRDEEFDHVATTVREICAEHRVGKPHRPARNKPR